MVTTEYSLWFLPLCLLIAVLYAGLLYVKANKPELALWVKRLAFFIRCTAVFLLLFLLLNPLIQTKQKEKEKPVLIVGLDNSESMRLCKDSTFYAKEFQKKMKQSIESLRNRYRVDTYLIGDSIQKGMDMDFSHKQTNLASFFDMVQSSYINKNVGALVLISDGIYNAGRNPLYAANAIKYPVYTMALGDTNVRKDILITKVNHNKSVYKDNFFPVEILVKAHKLMHQQALLRIKKSDEVVFEKQLRVTNNDYSEWVRLHLKAGETGLHAYTIRITPVEGEFTHANNTAQFFIEVVDKKEKVVILYHAPHPDVSAISQSIAQNETYEVETYLIDKFNKAIDDYNVVVLHQLPSKNNPAKSLLDDIQKLHMPVFYVLGKNTHFPWLNSLQIGLQIIPQREMYNDVYAVYNPNFTVFNLSSPSQLHLTDLPPVQVPYGNYQTANSAQILLYQKIGNITTSYPLLLYNQQLDKKTAVFAGDGLWRWRNYNYLFANNHDVFDEIISNTMQYLAIKEDKGFFRVESKNVYKENDNVVFDAELFNKNYELINDPEVSMLIADKENKYSYVFSRHLTSYHLDAGRFPPGDYHWKAWVKHGGETYEKTGRFSVNKIQIESIDLLANHQLLAGISANSQAAMFYPNQWEELEAAIKNNPEIKTRVYYNKKHTSLLNIYLLCLGIILLLGTEWVLRKWSGAY